MTSCAFCHLAYFISLFDEEIEENILICDVFKVNTLQRKNIKFALSTTNSRKVGDDAQRTLVTSEGGEKERNDFSLEPRSVEKSFRGGEGRGGNSLLPSSRGEKGKQTDPPFPPLPEMTFP